MDMEIEKISRGYRHQRDQLLVADAVLLDVAGVAGLSDDVDDVGI
jgi:hypothetical protein